MTNKIIYISIVGFQIAALSLFGIVNFSGWDKADVQQLEQKTFQINDKFNVSSTGENEFWIEDIRNEVFGKNESPLKGMTIADFD